MLDRDVVDSDGRKLLAVPLFSAIALASLILEHQNFFMFSLLHDTTVNNRIFHQRLADFNTIAIGNHQDLIKIDLGSNIPGDLLDLQCFPFFYSLLLPARCYDSIHARCLLFGA